MLKVHEHFLKVLKGGHQIFLVYHLVSYTVQTFKIQSLIFFCFTGDVFKAVISLYVADITLPLPSLDEVLICNHKTTVEEVCILVMNKIYLIMSCTLNVARFYKD